MIDLRSDTVTLPSSKMKEFILKAPLGDDVYGEDPSINQLQEQCAEIFNKESSLFVPSGTMANLVSVLAHCNRGDEILVGNKSHIFYYEAGGVSSVGGIHSYQLNNNDDGTINIDDIKKNIRQPGNDHFPKTRLLCLENTHNFCYGAPIPVEYFIKIKNLLNKYNIKMHLDGARIFNASVALKAPVASLTQNADSVSFCLSKGLSSPAGAIVLGDREFILKTKKIRKALGGGMRQAGILAAGGIFSLNNMVERLEEDHENAKILSKKLLDIKGLYIDIHKVQTNIIFIHLKNHTICDEEFLEKLNKNNIKIDYKGNRKFRLVTHCDFSKFQIDTVVTAINNILKD